MKKISIEELAEKMGEKVWTGSQKRIYLNKEGFNTRKMSTTTYIYEEDGIFKVSCYIKCPSQSLSWINSQRDIVKQDVLDRIDYLLAEDYFFLKNVKTNLFTCKYSSEEEFDKIIAADEKWIKREDAEIALSLLDNKNDYIIEIMNKESFNERKDEIYEKRRKRDQEERAKKTHDPLVPSDENFVKEYPIGSLVKSRVFGIGTVLSEDEIRVIIKFDVGEKMLIKEYAILEKIN